MSDIYNAFTKKKIHVELTDDVYPAVTAAFEAVKTKLPSLTNDFIDLRWNSKKNYFLLTFNMPVVLHFADGSSKSHHFAFDDITRQSVDLKDLKILLSSIGTVKPFLMSNYVVEIRPGVRIGLKWTDTVKLSDLIKLERLHMFETDQVGVAASHVRVAASPFAKAVPAKAPKPPRAVKAAVKAKSAAPVFPVLPISLRVPLPFVPTPMPVIAGGAGAAPAVAPAAIELGIGGFGCVSDRALPCIDAEKVAVTIHPSSGLNASPFVYKVQVKNDKLWDLNTSVIMTVDPLNNFLLPYESTCRVAENSDSLNCAPIKGKKEPIVQLSMRRGLDLEKPTEWLPLIKTSSQLTPAVMTLFVNLLDGCATLCNRMIVHGDIKPANILYFKEDARLRLIDYDFMSSFFLLENLSDEVKLQRAPFTREMLSQYIDHVTLNEIARRWRLNEISIWFTFSEVQYFPPNNCIAYYCVVNEDAKNFTHTPRWDSFKRIVETDFLAKHVALRIKEFRLENSRALALASQYVDLIKDSGKVYIQQFTAFLDYVIDKNKHGTVVDVFKDVYYPEKHDAYMLGGFLLQFFLKYNPDENEQSEWFLQVVNGLLQPDPRARLDISTARDALRRFAS